MVLKLYNTLTRKKEEFSPEKNNEVRMYVCGPTVNDVPHLGHARQQIVFDVLRRYLDYLGYEVKFVSNITDVEDKIIKKHEEENIPLRELINKNYKEHMEDYSSLNVKKPDIQPFATEYISQMINLIKNLEEKDYTYIIPGDGVYYDVSKFKGYGKLSHQNLEDLKSGARIEENSEKKNPHDFVLWKFSKEKEFEEFRWESPWGAGRPGWHIECSAMSHSLLGNPFDIHGGGQDLIFPHHEDEIAQSEAGYGKEMANYWVHNGMVNVEKEKMSKSLGNFKTIKELLKEYSGNVIRFFILSTHYRKPVDFNKKGLEDSKISYQRLKENILNLKNDGRENQEYIEKFQEAINNDLNTSKAIQVLWNLIRAEGTKGKYQTIKKMDEVLALDLISSEEGEIPEGIQNMLEEREVARKERNFEKADKLRDEIRAEGYKIIDTSEGPKLRKV